MRSPLSKVLIKPPLANPNLPDRFRRRADLNTPDQATFYGGEAKGYIDYPALP